jgi:hypothetical protein
MQIPQDYYRTHGILSSPGKLGYLFDPLPQDIAALCRIVQGVMIHIFWLGAYGLHVDEERKAEVQLRSVRRKLERILELDPRPLMTARPYESRLLGNCRDFSLLLTAILRHQGIPARARCGFGCYFMPDHYEDHWVCEYWNSSKQHWILVDAQLDELMCRKLHITFDPLDVPRNQFLVGGKAWQLCRNGEADPDAFGIFDMHGLWFIRGDLLRDVASLNKVELLPWDGWGLIDASDDEMGAEDLTLLDKVAALTAGDVPEFEQLRQLYEAEKRLRVPEKIHSYVQGGVQLVDLANI